MRMSVAASSSAETVTGNTAETGGGNTIAVIATGGTIACATDASGALVPQRNAQELVDQLGNLDVPVRAIDSAQLDSSSITLDQLDGLVAEVHAQLADPDIRGVVVTHGTDSMADTAIVLDIFHNSPKPVVLTGAQRPFDHPETDGLTNLTDSIRFATAPASSGVVIRFGGVTIPARGARKQHTSNLRAFAPTRCNRPDPVPVATLAGTSVAIIAAFPGSGRELVDAAVAAGFDGLVIEGLGSGNMGEEMGKGVADALDAGIKVVVSTRVPEGPVALDYGGAGGGATLGSKGAVGSGLLRVGQARMMLIVALATGRDVADLLS